MHSYLLSLVDNISTKIVVVDSNSLVRVLCHHRDLHHRREKMVAREVHLIDISLLEGEFRLGRMKSIQDQNDDHDYGDDNRDADSERLE